jgi:hypothetical protein
MTCIPAWSMASIILFGTVGGLVAGIAIGWASMAKWMSDGP